LHSAYCQQLNLNDVVTGVEHKEINWPSPNCSRLQTTFSLQTSLTLRISLIATCNVQKPFHGPFNEIFGSFGLIVKENVTGELLMKKCLPTLLYATLLCPLNKSDIRALDYIVDSAHQKIFETNFKKLHSNVD